MARLTRARNRKFLRRQYLQRRRKFRTFSHASPQGAEEPKPQFETALQKLGLTTAQIAQVRDAIAIGSPRLANFVSSIATRLGNLTPVQLQAAKGRVLSFLGSNS